MLVLRPTSIVAHVGQQCVRAYRRTGLPRSLAETPNEIAVGFYRKQVRRTRLLYIKEVAALKAVKTMEKAAVQSKREKIREINQAYTALTKIARETEHTSELTANAMAHQARLVAAQSLWEARWKRKQRFVFHRIAPLLSTTPVSDDNLASHLHRALSKPIEFNETPLPVPFKRQRKRRPVHEKLSLRRVKGDEKEWKTKY